MTTPRTRRGTTEGSPEIAYRSVGEGSPDVIVMPGWAAPGAYFDEFVAASHAADLRVTSFDPSGHGESPAAAEEWSLDLVDRMCLAVADATGAERFLLVGYGAAAKLVQHTALRHPDRVAGLVLVNGAPAAAIPTPADVLEGWYACAGDEEAFAKVLREFSDGRLDGETIERLAGQAALTQRDALVGSMETVIGTDFQDELDGLTVPTLVVAGRHDGIYSPEFLREEVVARIPGSRLAVIDAGHEIPVERPGDLAALVEAFAAGLRLPSVRG